MNPTISQRVQRSFSRSFKSYLSYANQQAWVAEKLISGLRDCGAPHHFSSTFEMGCGTGLLTCQLCSNFSHDILTLNDLSPEALQTANTHGARFLQGEVTQINWPDQPDLIASSSMIQWLSSPIALLYRASKALAPGGWLAISGFGCRQYEELAQLGTLAKAPGLCNPDKMLIALKDDLEIMIIQECLRPMYFPSALKVLVHLRKTGVNGRANKVWTKFYLNKFLDDYTRKFSYEDGVRLTYHPVWIIARKPG